MKTTELAGKTIAELKALAKKRKITLPSDARRADIVRALLKTGKGEGTAKTPKAKAKTKAKAKGAGKVTAAKKKGTAKATTKGRAKTEGTGKAGARPAAKGKTATAKRAVSAKRAALSAREPLAAQERVEDAKFFTGPLAQQHPFMGSLPLEYGEERIALLARDPDTVFCYWELPRTRLEKEGARQGKGSRLCVRIYDVTGIQFDGTNATSFFDQEVYERLGSWYFELRRPSHAFCADIGLRTPSGRFLTIARSNILFTPSAGVSDLADEEWQLTEEQLFRIFGAAPEGARGLSSEQLREWVRLHRGAAVSSPGVSSWGFPGSPRK
jgi:hypothetical protein